MTTIVDVARCAGVSVSTVSYALSGKRPVSGSTKAKVLRAAREIGYVPSISVAQGRIRTHVVAVSWPMDDSTAYGNWSPFVFSVSRCLRRHGCNMLLLSGENSDEELIRAMDCGMIDGAILLDVTVDDSRTFAAGLSCVPVVAIGCSRYTTRIMQVDLDFEQMGRKAVDIMAKAGHRHLLFVGGSEFAYQYGLNFLIRTRTAVTDSARKKELALTVLPMYSGDMQEMKTLADKALALDPMITGVIGQCGHVPLARLRHAFENRGMMVPDDMSMMELGSFGNGDETSSPLDEIPLQPYLICRRAVDILDDLIEGRRDRSKSEGIELLPVSYLRRGSVSKRPMVA